MIVDKIFLRLISSTSSSPQEKIQQYLQITLQNRRLLMMLEGYQCNDVKPRRFLKRTNIVGIRKKGAGGASVG
jgi:hypothetical protein